MIADLARFEYAGHDVRTVTIDGEPWFVLADLARVLEIASTARLASRLDEGVRLTHTLSTAGGDQQMTVVSEAGMYEVIIRSDKPEAASFRRWITSEVLPALRRTGTYTVPQQMPTHSEALRGWADAIERADAAEAKVVALEPKADAFDHFLNGDRDYSVGDAAKMLVSEGFLTGERRLFTTLSERGWIFRRENCWHLRQDKVDAGYGRMKPSTITFTRSDGSVGTGAPQVRIAGRGLEALRRLHARPLAVAE